MQKNPRVTVSCGTKFHSDHVAYQLSKRGFLHKVLTSHPAKYYLNRVPLQKKDVQFLPPVFLVVYGLRKLLGNNRLTNWLNYRMPVVYDRLAARSAKKTDVLLTWAWSGLKTIRTVKREGGITIVEECGSCNRFQNELLLEEYQRLGLAFEGPTPAFIVHRQLEEARLADYLLCPSKHVANSFVKYGIPADKCKVIPYGANTEHFKPQVREKKKFKILFVGTVGVRKGLIYLFKSLEILKENHDFECLLIGGLEEQFKPIFDQYSHLFKHLPHVPHKELVDYYNEASVFVFPSLDEGMALVQLEALACGVPVICTTNSGGDAVIEDGKEGFVVPIREPLLMAKKISLLIENPDLLNQMSTNARQKATTFSWDPDWLRKPLLWQHKVTLCTLCLPYRMKKVNTLTMLF
ncbi:MAG: glycosyltransferase family 1 protein [Chitinophagaceae bacterium]|nr:MAG: glycosyltransferase family 1 protein [Chitinophagaceae bacterium]